MVKTPVTVPLAGGVKVTLIEQLPELAKVAPHVLDSLKLLDPEVTEMLVMATDELPELFSVADPVVVEGENVRLVGETETLVPVPLKLTVCGLPLALSLMVRVAVGRAGGRGSECHADRARRTRGNTRAAGVGLGETSTRRDAWRRSGRRFPSR